MSHRAWSPLALEALLSAQLGVLPADWSARREALEALAQARPDAALDPLLLAARDVELALLAARDLPGVQRIGRLLTLDAISASFEALDSGGRPVAVRALRPAWRADPVWRRRLERRGATADPALLHPGAVEDHSGRLCQRVELPGPGLDAVAGGLDADTFARAVAAGLRALRVLQAARRPLGPLVPGQLRLGPEGVSLLWMDPVLERHPSPEDDLRALGQALLTLVPPDEEALGALTEGLAEHPPPTLDIAEGLLRAALGARLAERRHEVASRARGLASRRQTQHLLDLTRRLAAWTPPAGVVCLKAGPDATAWFVQVGPEATRGGQALEWPARLLPVVRGPEGALDPHAARALARAWATRTQGDEPRRRALQAELGSSDPQADLVVRWLTGLARLRTLARLMEHTLGA